LYFKLKDIKSSNWANELAFGIQDLQLSYGSGIYPNENMNGGNVHLTNNNYQLKKADHSIIISHEQWQVKLIEKYNALRNTVYEW
jgi:hypothetical protein